MGFLVSSGLLLISGIPFWFLPRSLPEQEGDEDKSTPAGETVDRKEDSLNNHHNLKITEIAKGTDDTLIAFLIQIYIYSTYLVLNYIKHIWIDSIPVLVFILDLLPQGFFPRWSVCLELLFTSCSFVAASWSSTPSLAGWLSKPNTWSNSLDSLRPEPTF